MLAKCYKPAINLLPTCYQLANCYLSACVSVKKSAAHSFAVKDYATKAVLQSKEG